MKKLLEQLTLKVRHLLWMICENEGHPHEVVECEDANCHICGMIDCPLGDPSHYSPDGCPSEDFEDEIEV